MTDLNMVAEKIREADFVLVGLGEALDKADLFPTDERYHELGAKAPWAVPFVKRILLKERAQKDAGQYGHLADCLREKNYFVVSLCRDGLIRTGGLDCSRIVEPCGGYEQLQCSEGCTKELYEVPQELSVRLGEFVNGGRRQDDWEEPLCPHCGKALVFNNTDALNYIEDGYLAQWQIYRKWLQGTVNKRFCVLELGVGMKYPTVIRWPFEKIVFFNWKAELFRVHDRLYQIPEEVGERGYGICQSPEDFIKELSVFFR